MAKPVKEREIKLFANGAVDPTAVRRVGSSLGFQVGDSARVSQRDTYLDDHWLHIAQSGAGLRMRTAGSATTVCWKSGADVDGGLHERRELELPWTRERPRRAADLDRPLADLVEPFVYRRRLEPLVRLDTDREAFLVRNGSGSAEVFVDHVAVVGGTGQRRSFCEIEIEVLQGPTEPWLAFARAIQSGQPVVQSRLSKLERALSLCGVRAPEDPAHAIEPGMTLGEAGFAVLRRLFHRLQHEEALARCDGRPRSVHRLRVASRRLRAAFGAIGAETLGEHAVFADAIVRRTARAFADVRELDTMIDRLEPTVGELPGPLRSAAAETLAALRERRKRRLRGARNHLTDRRRLRAFARFQEVLDGLSWPPARSGSSEPITTTGPRLVMLELNRVLAHGRVLLETSGARELHEVRIRIKRLRYVAELFETMYGSDLTRFVESTRTLQDLLGTHNDCAVAVRFLARWAARTARLSSAARIACGAWAALEDRRASGVRGEILAAWRTFDTPDLQTRLGAVFARAPHG